MSAKADEYYAKQEARLRGDEPLSAWDPAALRPLILAKTGDVGAVAEEIGVDSEELRTFIFNTPILRRALDEVVALGVDHALQVVLQGLQDEHFPNRLASAKELLKSRAAQRRGFHHAGDLELKLPKAGGALTLTWLPPEEPRKVPPMIEGKVED